MLDAQDNETIARPFDMEEIKTTLFSMKPNKAPGPDNIPIEFYQATWDIIKFDVMKLFSAFYKGDLSVSRLNYGIITLLPKLAGADKIQQYDLFH